MSKMIFFIENLEHSLTKVDDENNVSTAEGIFPDYDEGMQSENNNNNGVYVRCQSVKLCKAHRGLRAYKLFGQIFDSQELQNLF